EFLRFDPRNGHHTLDDAQHAVDSCRYERILSLGFHTQAVRDCENQAAQVICMSAMQVQMESRFISRIDPANRERESYRPVPRVTQFGTLTWGMIPVRHTEDSDC